MRRRIKQRHRVLTTRDMLDSCVRKERELYFKIDYSLKRAFPDIKERIEHIDKVLRKWDKENENLGTI